MKQKGPRHPGGLFLPADSPGREKNKTGLSLAGLGVFLETIINATLGAIKCHRMAI